MAKSYYGYVERDASSQINWAEVGSSINDTIQDVLKKREAKRQEIDQYTRDFSKILADSPQGLHQGTNDAMFDYAEKAREMMLISTDLLKRGEINLKQYTLQNQNLVDGTKQVFDAGDKFNEAYKVKYQRMQADCVNNPDVTCSSKLEQYLMGEMSDMINFNSHALYVNPTNYQVSLAKRKMVDGVYTSDIDDTPGSFLSVESINNRLITEYDVFDLNGYLSENAKDIKSFQYDSDGFLIDDPTVTKAYKKYREGITNSILVNPYATVSILTDITKENPENGEPWDFTFDPKEAKEDKNKVLLKVNPDNSGNPLVELSDSQKKVVKEQIHANLDVMVKREKKQLARQGGSGLTQVDKEIIGNMMELDTILSGSPTARGATVQTMIENYNNSSISKNSGQTMQDIDVLGDRINVSMVMQDSGERRNIPIWKVANNGAQPIDRDGMPTDDPNKFIYLPNHIVAEELNSYVNPERAGRFKADLITFSQSGGQFTGAYDPNYMGYMPSTETRERVVPADVDISKVVFEEGSGRTPAYYAMDELNTKTKTSDAATWVEKTLDFTLGQFLGDRTTSLHDAKVSAEMMGGRRKGEVEIKVEKKDGTTYTTFIPWHRGKNRNEFAKEVEDFYNALLGEFKAEKGMLNQATGSRYTMPDMTKYGAPQENDSKTFDPNKY